MAISLTTAAALTSSAVRAADVDVVVSSNQFNPHTVTVLVGDTVTWSNVSGFHNANADSGLFRCANGCDQTGGDGDLSSGAWSATFEFTLEGVEPYHCEQHGFPGGGMSGVVKTIRAIFADAFEAGDVDEWAPLDAAGDTCANPISLSPSNTDVPGTLRGANNDFDITTDATCFAGFASHGRDRVYSVLVPPNAVLQITVTPVEATSPNFDPVVYVQEDDSCGSSVPECLAASDVIGTGEQEIFSVPIAPNQRLLHVYIDTKRADTPGSDYLVRLETI